MYTEIDMKHSTLERVSQAIGALASSDAPLVIRHDPAAPLSLKRWADFLRTDCNLSLDTRQYAFDEKLELADWWEISNQPDKASSYAHSTTPQPFHNDNAWFADPAEINFFVMAKQAVSGGDQLIYPVSRIIEDLERIDPALLRDLVSTPVVIKKGDADYQNETPILVLDDGGRIYWNFYRTLKTDAFVKDLCDRFFTFLKAQEASDSVFPLHCESGDSLAFNDQRLLHARTAFEAHLPRDRVLYQSMWRLPKQTS